ncbi:hypothetical protein SPRG_19464 [Saprolegnia parasitica CBS 223.65]|uniref:TECPR1-like DysF domain-containing protein n=1 Tax=Saprolegnia parasitica (strain CBS 223.65) TaxID=695850 RepID=A0A067D1H2_SAPPC|nr:hypothetical protein SPRG_19464 [Saprolegnia parasitica CBS 223.65]KDO32606.1 hypothetical protein SPRG_19464 [Saprolegnia parasitica CBS 223.65]|eukprot:XP_012197067.1 hypothetical protein SPRG_19464 [Saprolegnia parasitica CBS 223.65]
MASSIRDRLEVFYTTHNPTKLGEIDRLLSQFAGAEATLLQTMHRKYGVRDLESDVAVDEVYENERYSFLTMGFGSSFPGHLTVLDRKRYSGSHGTPSSQVFEQVEPTLPESADPAYQWAWTGPWEIDATYVPCDRDGWTYAFDFSNFSPMLLKDEGKASPGMTDYTRRRRWARTRILNRVAPAVEDVEMPIKVELQELPEIPLPAPDANLPLRFYSKNLSLESHKNAWSHQVNKLQKLHARLEHIMAGRHLMWKRTKVELKAQVKSTLATVNDLRAQIAADEKRGVKDLATQSSLDVQLAHYEDLKRRIWFPKEKGYLLRGNLIGLFVGIKDIWVDTIKVQFGASISPLPDGTVRCHVTFKGQVTIRLHGVKLKAEKGTRVPNSRWSSVFLTTQCVGDLVLLYNATDGHWTPEPSKGIEFYKMQLKVTGGLDLPDGLFKMLLTEVANMLVQEVLFAHFPPELGPLFQHESSAFEVRGELQVEGPAIANLVDATLEPVNEREESKMPVQAFDDVATLLGLTRSQLNLLVGLRGFLLCPHRTLSSRCELSPRTFERTGWHLTPWTTSSPSSPSGHKRGSTCWNCCFSSASSILAGARTSSLTLKRVC